MANILIFHKRRLITHFIKRLRLTNDNEGLHNHQQLNHSFLSISVFFVELTRKKKNSLTWMSNECIDFPTNHFSYISKLLNICENELLGSPFNIILCLLKTMVNAIINWKILIRTKVFSSLNWSIQQTAARIPRIFFSLSPLVMVRVRRPWPTLLAWSVLTFDQKKSLKLNNWKF